MDADDDIALEGDHVFTLSLLDTLSTMRISHPGIARQCKQQVVFDIPTFLQSAMITKKWQCPHCLCPAPLGEIARDPYMRAVLDVLRHREDVEEIQIDEHARWRPKGGSEWFRITVR